MFFTIIACTAVLQFSACSSDDESYELVLKKEKESITINGVTFNLIRVDGGSFLMGSDSRYTDEKPIHQVDLLDYYIGETEVTQELWEAIIGNNPSKYKGKHRPIECVSWIDCYQFIDRLNKLTGLDFHLPTEAQWEYAAKGGIKSLGFMYSGSNTLNDVGWFKENSYKLTHEVATKLSNELGIYDMSGNVYEWCHDCYGGYSSITQTNPTKPINRNDVSLINRVIRGGSFQSDLCQTTNRLKYEMRMQNYDLGFRLAIDCKK